ncbi:MAG: 1-deoxy-D-xylulose-5-phosphate reductoisomerase [Alphaproteobacteria bacterium]|nr:1-deoxy-D-xylulose-5-phosphate reductoisomerase [Alphaproteobacteria bacterium]
MKKRIAVLGSTGSIGTQALEVIRGHPQLFEVEVLTAQNNCDLLIRQAIEFQPNAVVIGNKSCFANVHDALRSYPVKVFAGEDAIFQVVEMDSIDLVLCALVGYSGLKPVLNAIEAGKNIALANKESLVVAGELVMEAAHRKNVAIIPVDSEHSAIFQCLAGEQEQSVEKIILTASGGPFRGMKMEHLRQVTREAALNHPNWKMGHKITIDSASLMNKGLEVIEARWLFNMTPSKIEVVIHPQSVIHSMVQFIDGSVKAQLGVPDMKLPILYAFGFPLRIYSDQPRFHFSTNTRLTFEPPDTELFGNLKLAYLALEQGGNMPCVLNAANEAAVHAFLNERISFLYMTKVIEYCLEQACFIQKPTFEDYKETHTLTLEKANQFITEYT